MFNKHKSTIYHSLVILLAFLNFVVFVGKSEKKIAVPSTEVVEKNIPAVKGVLLLDEAYKHLGTPYKAAGKTPAGFDCSGFTYYVFRQFDIQLPRSSKGQINAGVEVPIEEAQQGDLIIFTGTDHSTGLPGHVGIVVTNNAGDISFIHSSSSRKNNGIIVTEMNDYYRKRFLQVRRVTT